MKLIYCCQPAQFFHAVNCWIDGRQDDESLWLLPAFKDLFTEGRKQLFLPRTSILSFDTQSISQQLNEWTLAQVLNNPEHKDRIHAVAHLMTEVLNDGQWSHKNKLIVSSCYTPEEAEKVLS